MEMLGIIMFNGKTMENLWNITILNGKTYYKTMAMFNGFAKLPEGKPHEIMFTVGVIKHGWLENPRTEWRF